MNEKLIHKCMINCLENPTEYKLFIQNKKLLSYQTLFICSIFHLMKKEAYNYLYSEKTKFLSKELFESKNFQPIHSFTGFKVKFRIGIIGFGEIGQKIFMILQKLFFPYQIIISTRQPEMHSDLTSREIIISSNTNWVISECDIICLSILPSQVNFFVRELDFKIIKNYHKKIFFSYVPGVTIEKLRKILKTKLCVKAKIVNFYLFKQLDNPMFCTRNLDNKKEIVRKIFRREKISLIQFSCPLKESNDEKKNLSFLQNLFFTFTSILEDGFSIPSQTAMMITTKLIFGKDVKIEKLVEKMNNYEKRVLFQDNQKNFHRNLDFVKIIFNESHLSSLFYRNYTKILMNLEKYK